MLTAVKQENWRANWNPGWGEERAPLSFGELRSEAWMARRRQRHNDLEKEISKPEEHIGMLAGEQARHIRRQKWGSPDSSIGQRDEKRSAERYSGPCPTGLVGMEDVWVLFQLRNHWGVWARQWSGLIIGSLVYGRWEGSCFHKLTSVI